jgi:glycosyltransferase involved in cell wall biosynthesis
VPALDTGGAERSTIDIAKALTAEGFRALVVSEGGRMEKELAAAGGELIRMPVASKHPVRILANARAMADIIRRENIALVHARSRAPAWSAFIAARRTGTPFVTTYHGIYNARGPLKRWYNSVMARGDAVIANSEWTARHILSTYSFPPKFLTVIPRGVDLGYFDPQRDATARTEALREQWRARQGHPIILLPGRLTRWKGQLVFVEALAKLRREARLPFGVRAVIAGDAQGRNAYAGKIVDAIEKNRLQDCVVLVRHVADMAAAYLTADIVVSASTDPEGFGRVPPEAAAMGRPVIATDHGGARETVLPGKSGLLVEPGNPAALGDALEDLLARPSAELAAMGRAGRAHIEANYSVERMQRETLSLYRALMSRARVDPDPSKGAISAQKTKGSEE